MLCQSLYLKVQLSSVENVIKASCNLHSSFQHVDVSNPENDMETWKRFIESLKNEQTSQINYSEQISKS